MNGSAQVLSRSPFISKSTLRFASCVVSTIFSRLQKFYGKQKCFLSFRSPWELLVAVILSAQCTDERVNKVTPLLFQRFSTVQDCADASQKEMEHFVHSTGFYRNKARHIRGAASMILSKFSGQVPGTMEELLMLPGVARKTANVILSVVFEQNEGVVVDTHVGRLSRRMGLTKEKDPKKIERDLMKLFMPELSGSDFLPEGLPRKNWHEFSLLLISHGRRICTARKAWCEQCPLQDICPKKI